MRTALQQRLRAAAAAFVALAFASPLCAQSTSLTGRVSALVDHIPNVPSTGTATELRLRAIVDATIDPKPWLRFRFAGVADALAASRGGSVYDASADALEAWIEVIGEKGDVRAGVGRLPWGRLDEVQPTDVINPLDVARYLLEGRSAARLPVAFVRGRLRSGDKLAIEGVLVPLFRPATFDRLDESTSPFNLLNDLPPPFDPSAVREPKWRFVRNEPARGRLQGGGRISATIGRVDWSLSAWRGFVPFGLVEASADPLTPNLVHPAYTMFGADLETVTGKWAWRAETAWFPRRPLQVEFAPRTFRGDVVEAGAGVDRRAGDFTLSATLLFRHIETLRPTTGRDRAGARRTLSLVSGFSRTFNRDRIETRVFSLVNPADEALFLRGALIWKPADDVAWEAWAASSTGEGDDAITRLGDRDFVSLRVTFYFGQ